MNILLNFSVHGIGFNGDIALDLVIGLINHVFQKDAEYKRTLGLITTCRKEESG